MSLRSSCPGKIMLAGEYAVIDGGPAIMIGVNSRAYAWLDEEGQSLSPFLHEVQGTLARHFGESSPQALAAKRVVVDTAAFRHGDAKLGLGSSAAATVTAMAAALAASERDLDPQQVQSLAAESHARAQAQMGARGSGADIAACTFGGCIRYQRRPDGAEIRPLTLPKGLCLVFPWTGVAASTPHLVSQIQEYRGRQPDAYEVHADAIQASAEQLANAAEAESVVSAVDAGAEAIRTLGDAAGVALWLPVHGQMETLATRLGGALKPTGAGGGDLALAALPDEDSAQKFRESLLKLGILCPEIDVDTQGVRLQV